MVLLVMLTNPTAGVASDWVTQKGVEERTTHLDRSIMVVCADSPMDSIDVVPMVAQHHRWRMQLHNASDSALRTSLHETDDLEVTCNILLMLLQLKRQ